jgi:predicted O-methyltransferase YrrM
MKNVRGWFPGPTELDWIEEASAPPESVFLAMEAVGDRDDVPIVDRHSGRVLRALAAGRRRIVEVGTAIGYSTLWLALGQPADGTIVTIDPDRSRTDQARRSWREAGIADERITQLNAPALDAFAAEEPALRGPFDLAFIDAIKTEYRHYLEALVPRLAPGALVVADNVLWGGRVAGSREPSPRDRNLEALRAFDEAMLRDPRFSATILPVGDGLLVAGFRG